MGGEDGGSQSSLTMMACTVLVVSVLALPDTFFAHLALNRFSYNATPCQVLFFHTTSRTHDRAPFRSR